MMPIAPVPVYLISLRCGCRAVCMAMCCFTEGNLASSQASPTRDIDSFQRIPFQLVYHDKWFDRSERDTIIYHRNAEVLVPQRLGLEALRMICCRSQAEYQTLLYLLTPGARERWVDKISVQPHLRLVHNQWTFVERVDMSEQRLVLTFNLSTEDHGSFDARLDLQPTEPTRHKWHSAQFEAKTRSLSFDLSKLAGTDDYIARFFLDDQLAFANRYQVDDLPF